MITYIHIHILFTDCYMIWVLNFKKWDERVFLLKEMTSLGGDKYLRDIRKFRDEGIVYHLICYTFMFITQFIIRLCLIVIVLFLGRTIIYTDES